MAIKAVEKKTEPEPSELELELEALKVENAALKEGNYSLLEQRAAATHAFDIERAEVRRLTRENEQMRMELQRQWERANMIPVPPPPPANMLGMQAAMREMASLDRFCTCVPGRADMFRRVPARPERPITNIERGLILARDYALQREAYSFMPIPKTSDD